MGNCSSEAQQAKLLRLDLTNDPTSFRVFVKKRNKFIPGTIYIYNQKPNLINSLPRMAKSE